MTEHGEGAFARKSALPTYDNLRELLARALRFVPPDDPLCGEIRITQHFATLRSRAFEKIDKICTGPYAAINFQEKTKLKALWPWLYENAVEGVVELSWDDLAVQLGYCRPTMISGRDLYEKLVGHGIIEPVDISNPPDRDENERRPVRLHPPEEWTASAVHL